MRRQTVNENGQTGPVTSRSSPVFALKGQASVLIFGIREEVFEASREALAEYLSELGDPLPRPRSTAELLIDAQRDWLLAQELAHSVMHPVEPAARDDLAPLELVALQSRSGGSYPPQFGA